MRRELGIVWNIIIHFVYALLLETQFQFLKRFGPDVNRIRRV